MRNFAYYLMMRHKEFEALIQKKLDMEITRIEDEFLTQHIGQCSECRQYYYEMEWLAQELKEVVEYFPSSEFNARVMAEIGIKPHKVWKRFVPSLVYIYLTTLIVLLISPLKTYLLSKTLLAVPGILHIIEKIRPIANGITIFAESILKYNLTQLGVGIILLVPIFYIFITILKKEEKWAHQNSY
ncbi:MAG: anti-sigma factor family protein [bacterium]